MWVDEKQEKDLARGVCVYVYVLVAQSCLHSWKDVLAETIGS